SGQQQQQQPSALTRCGSAPDGPRLLSAIDVQQLADKQQAAAPGAPSSALGFGALVLSAFLPSYPLPHSPAVTPAPSSPTTGSPVTLACFAAADVTLGPPGSTPFLQPTGLNLSTASGLVMESASLSTDCDTVLSYQQHFCDSRAVAGSLTVRAGMEGVVTMRDLEAGAVLVSSWQDGFTTLRNVTLTCPSPPAARQPPCRLAAVQDSQQLLQAFTTYVPAAVAAAANVTIVIAANITISPSWPATPVSVGGNVMLVGSPLLGVVVLDLQLRVGLWDLQPSALVVLEKLTCVNLAPTYFTVALVFSQFGPLAERMWAFNRSNRQLHVQGCTLVVPQDELAYSRYWITFLVSPVSEAQAKAAWLRVVELKVLAVNSSGVYYDRLASFTTLYINVRITNSLGDYPLLPQQGLLSQLQAEDVPLTAVNAVNNKADFQLALLPNNSNPDEQGRRWLLLLGNISLAANTSQPVSAPLALLGDTVLLPVPKEQPRRLSLAVAAALAVPEFATFRIRQLLLDGLAPLASTYDPQAPLAALASPLWGLSLSPTSSVNLSNCTLLLGADELRLIQQALLPADQAKALPVGRSYDAVLIAAVQSFFGSALRLGSYNASALAIVTGATPRYSLTNVSFRLPVLAYGESAGPNFTALGVPLERAADPGASRSSGLAPWAVGVLVGCVVGGVLLAAAVLFAVWQRRAQQKRASSEAGAYERYLRDGRTAAGGGQQCGSDLVPPSQEMTNSSQVLRPGGRADVGAAASVAMTMGGRTSGLGPGGGPGMAAAGKQTSGSAIGAGSSSFATARGEGSLAAGDGTPAAPRARNTDAMGFTTQVSDSFEQPPTSSAIGQPGGRAHAGPGRPGGAHMAGLMTTGNVLSTTTETGSGSGAAAASTPGMMTTGGGSLEQMHSIISLLGRDFNDKQLAVHNLLGKGAHGTVYRGTWRGLAVAVKSMIFNSDNNARQQQRPLLEAAISSNLAHTNIVTTYSYELREVEHELASLSPELARQGGGWRLLIIQEYCDAGPLRRLVDCGFFLTPPKPSPSRAKLKLTSVLLRRDSPSHGEGSGGGTVRLAATTEPGVATSSRGSSGSNGAGTAPGPGTGSGSGGRGSPGDPPALQPTHSGHAPDGNGGGHGGGGSGGGGTAAPRPLLEDAADMGPRPMSNLDAALRYTEAALMIARGLQHIHAKNIVHGDLNPNNVLLVRTHETPLGFCLKVADFGLSVRVGEGQSHLSNLFQGSPYYVAPEVMLSGKVGKSADIFSLGIMLWELQNGTRPPWRMGVRLRGYPSLNTGELTFGPETPPRYIRLTRDCFHASKDTRPIIAHVVDTLVSIKAELAALRGGT
ncbi:putative serine/threonine-protein kinase, partial [Tetrabaena socialis]